MKKAKIFILLSVAISLTIGIFQNCSQNFVSREIIDNLSIVHPSVDVVLGSSQKTVVASKTYVAELMRDIFLPSEPPTALKTFELGQLNLTEGQGVDFGDFKLWMQGDGNVVIYTKEMKPVWYTSTNGQCTQCLFVFQADGNLVLYDRAPNPMKPLWSSNTYNRGKRVGLYESPPWLGVLLDEKTFGYPEKYDVGTALNEKLEQWIVTRPSAFGGSCNPYDTYGTIDCGGDVTNAALPVYTEASSLRESYRLQFCSEVSADNDLLAAALSKIPARKSDTPNVTTIGGLYELFYRDESPSDEIIETLMTLDSELAKAGEPPLERWRALLLQVCNSPGWQLL